LLERIEQHYGIPNSPRFAGPFEMILWEIVAYLADDVRRGIAFEALRNRVGLNPRQILAAPKKLLCEITRMGGSIAAEERAERLQTAAQLALDEFSGDLANVLKLVPHNSKKLLMRFPMIGEPGAEKILLFFGVLSVLALESNGVRF
jgi:endonuclease-3